MPTPRRTLILTTTVAMTLLATACGGSGGDTSDPGPAAPAGDNPMGAYIQCLQQNGVTMTMPSGGPGAGRPSGAPDAGPSGPPSGMPLPSGNVPPGQGFPGGGMGRPAGVDEETWNKAQSACAALQPSMGAFPGGGASPTP